MTFDDFIGKWNTKGIDFDGAYGDQCMDLMHQYIVEVLGIPDGRVLAAPAAKDVWYTTPYGKDKFEAITNSATNVPLKGDILLWGTGIGPYGHVAIFLDGDASNFRSFDQNFPTNSKCHLQSHNYTGLEGWLRLKGAPPVANTTEIDAIRKERDTNWNLYQEAKISLEKEQAITNSLNATIGNLNASLAQANSKLNTLDTQVTELTKVNETLQKKADQVPGLIEQVSVLEAAKLRWFEAEKGYTKAILQLRKDNQFLKENAGKAFLSQILNKFGIKA